MTVGDGQEGSKVVCYHCGDECSNKRISIDQKHFCCSGCKMVFELLNKNELCAYYDLNRNPGLAQRNEIRKDKFDFLDDNSIVQKLINFTDGKQTQVTFYIPQMHCSSCLWLLENIHRINEGVTNSRVDFLKKEVFIVFDNNETTLRKVVETLSEIGYEPHINLQDVGSKGVNSGVNKRLSKIGVSGFCFASIMMLSLPEYFALGGFLEKEIGSALQYFILILSLPVVFYCATEFFITAWKGLKNKFLNIDLPIALAILITFLRSLYELQTQTGSGYLDSMSGIIFFMLVGRFVQDKTYKSISFDRDFKSFFPIAVHVFRDDEFKPCIVDQLKVEDVIKIHANEIIPVDAILSKGRAEIDYSFVSGESVPLAPQIGEIIYAGGRQIAASIELIVVKEVSQSYLTGLWNNDIFKTEKQSKSTIHDFSKYFTAIVLLIGFFAAVFWFSRAEYHLMWNALTTILIVACPCALLLSSTFTNGNILRIFSKNKFYLRHADVIDNLSKINHIVFDKTGTLTQSKQMKVRYSGLPLSPAQKDNLVALLSQSSHPLSRMVYDFLGIIPVSEVESFTEFAGKGIEGKVNGCLIRIGSADFVGLDDDRFSLKGTNVCVKIDDVIFGGFCIENIYRSGFDTALQTLRKKFLLSVLSGDNDSEAGFLKRFFGGNAPMLFNCRPDEKLAYIGFLQKDAANNVLMIGDGLNDAGALKKSNVGIALSDGNNNFTPSADGILDASQFAILPQLLAFAKSGRVIVLISFVLSILYNIVGLYFAVQGTLSPVIAAILMPASSLSIVLLTYSLTEVLARRRGLQ